MPPAASDVPRSVLKACRRHLVTAAAFSLAINLLHLAAPLYMMQVYDRVVSSGSGATLFMLTVIVLVAFAALGGLEYARSRVLIAASVRLDRLLAGRAFEVAMQRAVGGGERRHQMLQDLDACRQFVSGHAMPALFDLPWMPIYLAMIFVLHWTLGFFALGCAALLVGLAMASEWRLRTLTRSVQSGAAASHAVADASLRNADVVAAMGMLPALLAHWRLRRSGAVVTQHDLAGRTASMAAIVRVLRLSMQSLVLGLGAWLVIDRAMSGASIFAASLLLGRALQPIEQAIGQWQSLLAARAAAVRLAGSLGTTSRASGAPPSATRHANGLVADCVGFAVPGRAQPILAGIGFAVAPGECVGLIGPSGAGKSTLTRLLVGAARPTAGAIRLDGIPVTELSDRPGPSPVGYLPQDVQLFDGTVADNIARFSESPPHDVVRAAMLAGAHDLIAALPRGYLTDIGDGGCALSGGMRQRIALARAVFGRPRLVVLDEPSSNLDRQGDAALAACVRQLTADGCAVVLVSHRAETTALMEKFLVLIDGRLQAAGSRQEVAQQLASRLGRPATASPPPVRVARRQGADPSGGEQAGREHAGAVPVRVGGGAR